MRDKYYPGELVYIRNSKYPGMIIEYIGIKKVRTGMSRFESYPVYLVQDFKTGTLKEIPTIILRKP
tara:strand:- start:704 stop:901 length:198 start_codon:yes stop_codon:yes gene_type:complete